MNKKFLRILLLVIFSLSLLLVGQVTLADTQKTFAASLQQQANPTPTALGIEETRVSFEALQQDGIRLIGPYDATYIPFSIPNSWAISPGSQLNLNLLVSYDQRVLTEFDYPVVMSGGTITVYLNGTLLGILPLNENGEIQKSLSIPTWAFVSNRDDGLMELYIELDASDFCYVDDEFSLFIYPTSEFYLPHEIVFPDTNLQKYPYVIYQDTFIEETTLIVVPDDPSSIELQSALIVAAGLEGFSQNDIALDITTLSELNSEKRTTSNLIFIGKASSLNILEELPLPVPITNGLLQSSGSNPDDGFAQLIVSPWNQTRVLFLVSGNTDSAVEKAAQAVSTGTLRPNKSPNLSIIEEVKPTEEVAQIPETRTLADVGYDNQIFSTRGFSSFTYSFVIPPGSTVTSDAYFELAYGNSAVLDFEQSSVIVLLNNVPIGSIKFSDETANQAVNKLKIDIPKLVIQPGVNRLEVRGYLLPDDFCTPPNVRSLWVTIWKDSTLHLPITQDQTDYRTTLDLADFPAPYIFDSELGNSTFVLPKNDLVAWRGAMQIAGYMASSANAPILMFSAYYGDELPEDARTDNLFFIGRPSQLPVIRELNDALPVPFREGSDQALDESFRVIYNIPDEVPLGYVEFLQSPWNPDSVIIALLANSEQGEKWATASFDDDTLRTQFAGNFAVINDRQILTTDTRLFPISESQTSDGEIPEISVQTATPVTGLQPATRLQNQDWIPLALMISAGLIVLILIIVLVRSFLQRRSRL